VEDTLDAMQFAGEFRRLKGAVKLVPEDLSSFGIGGLPVPFERDRFDERGGWPKFSDAPPFYWGATVSYLMIQLAAFLGCAEAVLLGHDFRYETDGVAESADGVWTVRGRDRNHFHDAYWPHGARAFAARPAQMRRAFESARALAPAVGMRIVNATPGTALDVFPLADLRELTGGVACTAPAASTS
jgi:hypothetical protein